VRPLADFSLVSVDGRTVRFKQCNFCSKDRSEKYNAHRRAERAKIPKAPKLATESDVSGWGYL